MIGWSTEHEDIIIISTECPLCEQVANIKISREVKWICLFILINLWYSGEYFGTCGNCHQSFKIDRDIVSDIIKETGINFRESFAIRNSISLGIVFLIILVIYILSL